MGSPFWAKYWPFSPKNLSVVRWWDRYVMYRITCCMNDGIHCLGLEVYLPYKRAIRDGWIALAALRFIDMNARERRGGL